MKIDTTKVKGVKTEKFNLEKARKTILEKVKTEQAGDLSESEKTHLNLWTTDDRGCVWFW